MASWPWARHPLPLLLLLGVANAPAAKRSLPAWRTRGWPTGRKNLRSVMRGWWWAFFWLSPLIYKWHLPILYDCALTWCDHSYSWFGSHFAQTPWHMHGTLQTQVPCAVASRCSSGHLPQDARVCAPGRRVRSGIGGFVETWLGGNAGTQHWHAWVSMSEDLWDIITAYTLCCWFSTYSCCFSWIFCISLRLLLTCLGLQWFGTTI